MTTYRMILADPAGNTTLLVLNPVPLPLRPALAARLMTLSTAEQVGAVRLPWR